MITMCESCGRDEEVVSPVRRVYLSFGNDGEQQEPETAVETEAWCLVCREHYPHEPL